MIKSKVLAYIARNEPVHMNQIVNAMWWSLGEDAVRSAVQELVSEGKIRSTSDGYVTC